MTIRDDVTTANLNINTSRLLVANDITAQSASFSNISSVFTNEGINKVVLNSLSSPTFTLNDGTHNAQLSTTDLTFNTVSLPSQVSTNTTNIGTNTSSITTLQIKQTAVINQYISAAIYADGRPPTAPTTTIAQTYAYTPSWYFKNTVAGYKINWYVGATAGLKVSDILGMYCSFFNPSMTSNDNCPFITVYTAPTGSGDYAPGFFHSSCTYIFNQSVTPVVNTRYTMFANLNSCPDPNHYGSTLVSMQVSPVAPNPKGSYLPTEVVGFFAIGSNSASAVNSVEFAVSKFGIMTANGTTEVNYFQN
jgi:hypothetical protein